MALLPEEVNTIKGQLGIVGSSTTKVASSAIVRLYFSSPNPNNKNSPILKQFPKLSGKEWVNSGLEGALVVIVSKRCMFFQLFNLKSYKPMFKYEVYEGMEFNKENETLYSFEIEDCMAGFSFADRKDAIKTFQVVNSLRPQVSSSKNKKKKPKKKGKAKKGKKGELEDGDFKILNVQRGAHMALNPDGTMDMNNIPETWKKLFKQAGIRKKDLKNPATASAIMNVIETDDMTKSRIFQQSPHPGQYTDEEREAYRLQQQQIELYRQHQQGLEAWEQANQAMLSMQQQSPDLPPRQYQGQFVPREPPMPPPDMIAKTPSMNQGEVEKIVAAIHEPEPAKPSGGGGGGLIQADALKGAAMKLKKTTTPEVKKAADPPKMTAHDIFLKELMGNKLKKTVVAPKLPDAERFDDGRKNSLVKKLQGALDARRGALGGAEEDNDSDDESVWSESDNGY